jgi:LysR family transcriptional regulator, carnitine catabolism transcriptional activator
MNIDLGIRQLRTVVEVADHGGFTAASRSLRVAQSSLSRTVLDVERRLGVTLFERSTRHVVPTRDGEEFVALARHVLSEFDGAMEHFSGYLSGRRGSVSVAALPSLAATLLPPVLSAYRAAWPEVAVTVHDGLSREVLDKVLTGAVDFAVTVAPDVPPQLTATRIAVDRFVCIFAPGHRFDRRRRVTWEDLEGEPFVAFDLSSSIRTHTDRVLGEAQVRTGPTTEARNIGAVAGLVGADLGVSAVPGLVLPMMRFAGIRRRPLEQPLLERNVCLVRNPRRPLSPAVAALVTMLEDAGSHGIELPPGSRWVDR